MTRCRVESAMPVMGPEVSTERITSKKGPKYVRGSRVLQSVHTNTFRRSTCRGDILMMDQANAGRVGIFARWTNRMRAVRVRGPRQGEIREADYLRSRQRPSSSHRHLPGRVKPPLPSAARPGAQS
eukprot:5532812-Pyramimonas_sp.AAC.1